MRRFRTPGVVLFAALAIVCGGLVSTSQATHIDQLGIDVSVFSSDGSGNFSILYRTFLGSDGSSWSGSAWDGLFISGNNAATATYTALGPLNTSLLQGPGTLSPTSISPAQQFDGLVDMNGNPTAGFGPGQFNTQFVNDLSDASQWSTILDYTISGFDLTATYLVDLTATDCCFVSGSTPVFNSQIQFDPTQVINPGMDPVPEPSTWMLMGTGLVGLVGYGWRRRQQNT